jgi:hypothetical protein
MRYLNGAEIPAGDLGTIAEYLARTQGASLPQVLVTWASTLYGLRRRRRADRRGIAGG